MNKKGFTLVELVITIGLLGLLGMVIVSNMSGLLNKQQDKQYASFKESLTKAACSYIHLNAAKDEENPNKSLKSTCIIKKTCSVTVGRLVEQGLISDEDLIDPRNKERLSNSTPILITYQNNEFTCSIDSID